MSLNIVNNRSSFANFRATLNTWVASLNTANTNITTNTSDIGTLQGEMTTAQGDITAAQGDISSLQGAISVIQSDVAGKQDKNAISTLLYGYKTTAGTYTLLDTDLNYIVVITNVGTSVFNLPLSSSIPNFTVGGAVTVYNTAASSNVITLKNAVGVNLITTSSFPATVAVGDVAKLVMVAADTYLRIQ